MYPPELIALVVAVALTALLSLPVQLPGIDAMLTGDAETESPDDH